MVPSVVILVLFFLYLQQRHVIMNIHGHTHDASGRVRIGNITVLNPGALVEGNFAIYTLESSGKSTQKWELSSTCFYKLP